MVLLNGLAPKLGSNPISEKILSGEFKENDHIIVKGRNGKIVLEKNKEKVDKKRNQKKNINHDIRK